MVEEQKMVRGDHTQKRLPFAYKLHLMLSEMEDKGTSHIISWVGDGSAFKIHNPDEFEKTIQQSYFEQSKIASFIRQCYAYGFAKIEDPQDIRCGAFVHPDFQRDDKARALAIKRRDGGRRRRRNRRKNAESLDQRELFSMYTGDKLCGNNSSSSDESKVSLHLRMFPSENGTKNLSVDVNSLNRGINSGHRLDFGIDTPGVALVSSIPPNRPTFRRDVMLDLQMEYASQIPCGFDEFMSIMEPRPIESMLKDNAASLPKGNP